MKIYGIDNNELLDVLVTESANHEEEMMKSDFVKLSWDSDIKLTIPVGAYIIPFGDGLKYSLLETYKPTQIDEASFKYEPEFQHPKMWLGKVPFVRFDSKHDWEYTGFTMTLLQYVVDAINEAFGFTTDENKFSYTILGTVDNTVSLTFDSVDVLSGISQIANVCKENCEWHLDWNQKTLYFGQISYDSGDGTIPTLKVGQNIGKVSVTENKDGYYNIFYPQGSTRNMGVKTASGEYVSEGIRLELDKVKYPTSMIDVRNDPNEPKQTLAVIFDDIYPHVDCYAYNIRKKTDFLLQEGTNDKVIDHYDGSGNPIYKMYSIWYMRLAYPTYDANGNVTTWTDYLIEDSQILDGFKPCITFKPNLISGALSSSLAGQPSSGDGFEIAYQKTDDNDTTLDDGSKVKAGDYEIVFVKQGENNLIIPTTDDIGLIPRGEENPSLKGNLVVIYNITMGANEILAAQQELADAMLKDIERRKKDWNNYSFSSNPDIFEQSNPNLYIGRKILYDDGHGYLLTTRILKLVTKLDYPIEQDITVGNQQIKGSSSQLKEDVKQIMSGNFEGAGVSISQVKNLISNYVESKSLSKVHPDTAKELITFLDGIAFKDGKGIDSNGNAILNSIEIDDFVSKLSGGFFGKDINGNIYLETGKLYVRAKAYFENLEIIKTQYSYGNRIVGKGGIKVNNIEMLDINGNIISDELQCNAYRCYFLTEQEGIKIYNPFIVGDQAIAKEFNIAEGNNTHVANHYLWRAVVSVGENYIDLSKDICDVNSDAPIVSDELCQLGYRGDGNEDRTCAIMENIAGENVPSYIMLKGITDFSLSEKDILSMGYDNITGKAYFRVYGEAYIGDRGRSNFFEFADGKATFNGEAHFKEGTDGGENISGITSSTTNLILNSGFSGNFETKKLDDITTLEEATQMYSPSLYGWDGDATVKADVESLSGFSATITESISQTISAKLSVNNVYSFTCKAKGSFVTIKIAGNEYPFTLNTEYETLKIYVSPILGNTIEISGDCEICEPMLVLGGVFALWQRSPLDNDKATGIQVALSYLSEALQNDTTINGGLLTSTIIKLGRKILGEWEEAAGMSGIYNDDNDVAFYAGGTFKQAITTVIRYITNPTYKPTQLELQDMAKFVVTHGGRAILNDAIFRGIVYAEGGILRNIKTPNGSLNIDEDGNIEIEGKFSSGKNERKIVIDPELGNITMFDVFTNTEGILVTRPALRIDQTFLPNLTNLGLRPNVTVLGYAPNGDIWKTITLSTEGIIADIEDSSYHTYYNIGEDGISYNRIDKSKTENQSTLLYFGIGRGSGTDNTIDILNLTCTSWPTYAQASTGGIYLENGYLKIK